MIRAGTFLLAMICAANAAAGETVRVLNWDEYIDPSVIEEFEAETGIDVIYEEYDDAELAEAMLMAGEPQFDVAIVSSEYVGRLIAMGIVQSLDTGSLGNLGHLDSGIMTRFEALDRVESFGVPYLWGSTGIGYDATAVAERMPEAPVDSWSMIFDPAVVSRFADCGVSLLDVPEEMTAVALNYLGYAPTTADPRAIGKALDLLRGVMPYVSTFDTEHAWRLSDGDVCLAVGWSGDVMAVIDEQDGGRDIRYSIPKEGAPIWFDIMLVPSASANPDAAHRFIDFILRPEVIARITNEVWYPSTNTASLAHVDPEIRDNPMIFPPEDEAARLFVVGSRSAKEKRDLARAWRRLEIGI